MSLKGYIYKYTYPNGKVYIGQTTTSVEKRWQEHVSNSKRLRSKMVCDAAIHKYGKENIKIEVLEEVEVDEKKPTLLVEKLNKLERKYISEYDSANIAKGYNILLGGERKPLAQKILDEKWYELFDEQKWGEALSYFEYMLFERIKPKVCETHEKLDKDERYVWYGYKFMDDTTMKETTFCGYFKRYRDFPFVYDIGDFGYDENGKLEEPIGAEKEKYLFDKLIKRAIEDNWIEDIRQTIWKEVMRNKNKVINDYKLTSVGK
jgi:group I intron endonuclease